MEKEKNFKRIFRLNNKLRDLNIKNVVSLPKIVVIGSQSVGKSSLLEAILGRDCLPRGDGMTTKVPLELRLQKHEFEEERAELRVEEEIISAKGASIEKEIRNFQNKILEEGKMASNTPIQMTYFSNAVQDLTLIDLPGLIRSAPNDDNEAPRIIEEMAMNYIQDPQSIIVCVMVADQDLGNSDALKLIKSIDGAMDRTVGVLSKADKAEKGVRIVHDCFEGTKFRLDHGYFAVKNRTAKDRELDKSIKRSLEEEKAFFEKSEIFRPYLDQCGTSNLIAKLAKIVYEKTIDALPAIDDQIQQNIKKFRSKLAEFGEPIPKDPKYKVNYLNTLSETIQKIINEIVSEDTQIPGTGSFKTKFQIILDKFLNSLKSVFVKWVEKTDIRSVIIKIYQNKGLSLSNIIPDKIIQKQIQEELGHIDKERIKFINEVDQLSKKVFSEAFKRAFNQPNPFMAKFEKMSQQYQKQIVQQADFLTKKLIESEMETIWSSNKDLEHILLKTEKQFKAEVKSYESTEERQKYITSSICQLQRFTANSQIQIIKNIHFIFDFKCLDIQDIQNELSTLFSEEELLSAKTKTKKKEIVNIHYTVSPELVTGFYQTVVKYLFIISSNLSDSISKFIRLEMVKPLKDFTKFAVKKIIDQPDFEKLHENSNVYKERKSIKEELKKCETALEYIENEKNYDEELEEEKDQDSYLVSAICFSDDEDE